MAELYQEILGEFEDITKFKPQLPPEYAQALFDLCEFLKDKPLRRKSQRRRWLLSHINHKFRLNKSSIAKVYGVAAKSGIVFNYHDKEAIKQAFDLSDQAAFVHIFQEKGLPPSLKIRLLELFQPMSEQETINALVSEIDQPSKLRIEKGERRIDLHILMTVLASFAFSLAEEEVLHSYFDRNYASDRYEESFWLQLRASKPELYDRKHTLEVVRLNATFAESFDDQESLERSVMEIIQSSYSNLDNHGHLAIWVDPLAIAGQTITWQLVESFKLFAEKFDEVPLTRKYFPHQLIANETDSYVPNLVFDKARFDLANEGFTYKDCFVLCPSPNAPFGSEGLLVLFQKNQRDETPIPCPACRSQDVQGNSYSSLGVRSWECGNLLCPDRSKYNRGKRYSFKSLLRQEAITHPENHISDGLVKLWSRDVQYGREPAEVIEMVVRFYSLYGDSIHFVGFSPFGPEELYGRRVRRHAIGLNPQESEAGSFFDSAWFNRYVVDDGVPAPLETRTRSVTIGPFHSIQGDSRTELRLFRDNYFDGAVTSPPYYNAREYAQWPNIYCYLYDMFAVIRECHRVLKPGAAFLFNIFDNFDNERSIALSAMGDKKLVLSSMVVDLFRRAGFSLCGNVVWDKGSIEGKRAFNGGNLSPYYQSPFNCWEHILVFAKLGHGTNLGQENFARLPSVLKAQPVVKMVRGKNKYGHSAPFPIEVPALLTNLVDSGSIVLDPFGGSGTTARALCSRGTKVVCIEKDGNYCKLAEDSFRDFFLEQELLDLASIPTLDEG